MSFLSKRSLKGGDLLLLGDKFRVEGGCELIDFDLVVGGEFLVSVGLDLELIGKEGIFLVGLIRLFLEEGGLLLGGYL